MDIPPHIQKNFDVDKLFFIIILNEFDYSFEKRHRFWALFINSYYKYVRDFDFLEYYSIAEELERRNSLFKFRHSKHYFCLFQKGQLSLKAYCQIVEAFQRFGFY
jgi:hypothetical protein